MLFSAATADTFSSGSDRSRSCTPADDGLATRTGMRLRRRGTPEDRVWSIVRRARIRDARALSPEKKSHTFMDWVRNYRDPESGQLYSEYEHKFLSKNQTIRVRRLISEVVPTAGGDDQGLRQALLDWSRESLAPYDDVAVRDFAASWRDGRAFLHIIHRYRPELVDLQSIRHQTGRQRLELAFRLAEQHLSVPPLLDVRDVDVSAPDERAVIAYVSRLCDVFPQSPPSKLDETEQLVDEYNRRGGVLFSWMREATQMLLDCRSCPNGYQHVFAERRAFEEFQNEDLPPRLLEKNQLSSIYKQLKSASGTNSSNVESALQMDNLDRMWERLELAQQERDLALQAELSRCRCLTALQNAILIAYLFLNW